MGTNLRKKDIIKETKGPYLTVKDKKQAICLLQQFFSPNAQSLLDFPRVSSWLKFKYFNDGNIQKQRFFEAVDSVVLTLAFMTLQNVKSGFPSNSNWGGIFDLSNWDHFITEVKTLFQSILLKFLKGEKYYSSETWFQGTKFGVASNKKTTSLWMLHCLILLWLPSRLILKLPSRFIWAIEKPSYNSFQLSCPFESFAKHL